MPPETLKEIVQRARERNHASIVANIDRCMEDDTLFLLTASNFAEYMTEAHWKRLSEIHPDAEFRETIQAQLKQDECARAAGMTYRGHLNELIHDAGIEKILAGHGFDQPGLLAAVRQVLVAAAVRQMVRSCKALECPREIPDDVELVADEVLTYELLGQKYPALCYVFDAESGNSLELFGEPITEKQWAFMEDMYFARVEMIKQFPTGKAVKNGASTATGVEVYEPDDLCQRYNALLHEKLLASDAFSGEFQAGIANIPPPSSILIPKD